ncbi:EamA family transporter [Mycolicibacterium sp. YH-1]|uniref:EamA family transporter n=1 Tax=Mycolicibacterium sp. YH-1 TaxID=2908837 RepID=UPI001F4C3B9D|nr:EamA family transporter [Mycolicibacterium sp. YH-1]UNB54582.1 EamA family transporter [Mycolicibacterium sp. YH-1]
MTVVLFAALSSIAFGGSDFCGGLASRRFATLKVLVVAAPATLIIDLAAWHAFGGTWSVSAAAWGGISGAAYAVGFGLLYWCLANGPIIVLSPVSATVSALIPVAAGLSFGETLTSVGLAGTVIAIVAVFLLGLSGDESREVSTRPTMLTLGAAIGAGAAVALQLICLDRAPHQSGMAPVVAGSAVATLLVWTAVPLVRARIGSDGRLRDWSAAVAAGVLDSLATIAFLLAVRAGDLAVVAVITALYPAGTIVLARLVLRETVSRVQFGGLLTAGLAVTLLALSS